MRTLREHPKNAHVRAVLPAAAAAIAALTLSACGGATPASGDVHPGSADGRATTIIALDNEFEPAVLELDPGSEATLEITNEGEQPHNLVIDEVELSSGTLEPGDVVTASFTVPEATVAYYCSFHPGMDGEIRPKAG